jgi:hypothetical protein
MNFFVLMASMLKCLNLDVISVLTDMQKIDFPSATTKMTEYQMYLITKHPQHGGVCPILKLC